MVPAVMRIGVTLLLLLCTFPLQAAQTVVDNLRFWAAPDHTRLVLDISAPVDHTIFSLQAPKRLVIDIENAKMSAQLTEQAIDDPRIKQARSGIRKGNGLRIVLDLKVPVSPRSFVLEPNRQYGHRLVVDLFAPDEEAQKTVKKWAPKSTRREVVVAVDAGHGGEDPGARGRYGTHEKDVVLAIARRLTKLINKERGMRAVLIRDGDYYLGLRKRMQLARRHKADLFVSIHADAFRDRRVQGSSVYTLSSRGASSEAARWLAERENSADLVGGVELKGKDDVLRSVLLDLSQTATQQMSYEVAGSVLKQMRSVGKTHKNTVQRAGFMVLKSPDIPSILIETAFITNPKEEKRLKTSAHQNKLARSMLSGIRTYFHDNPPPGSLLASLKPREHVISKGDTLGMIARHYQISLEELRSANDIKGERIQVGQVLRIPNT